MHLFHSQCFLCLFLFLHIFRFVKHPTVRTPALLQSWCKTRKYKRWDCCTRSCSSFLSSSYWFVSGELCDLSFIFTKDIMRKLKVVLKTCYKYFRSVYFTRVYPIVEISCRKRAVSKNVVTILFCTLPHLFILGSTLCTPWHLCTSFHENCVSGLSRNACVFS